MITVIGSSNTDFTIKSDNFPAVGETVLGGEFFISGGGKGANQAACIAKLGGKVNLLANIGLDHFGRNAAANLKRLGVNTKYIKRDKDHHSGVAFIQVDKTGRNLITVSPGSNSFLWPEDVLGRKECIKKSDALLIQLEIPLKTVSAAIRLGSKLGKLIILNPAPARRLTRDILSRVDVLIPNEVELLMFGGVNLLLKAGVRCVIITLGKKGALLVTRKKKEFFKAKKVRPLDTTCAGDAFCGAVAVGLDKGKTIEEAIEFANCAAALTTTKLGAQSSLPTLKEVKQFLLRGRAAW